MNTDEVRYYLEAHITIEPIFGAQHAAAEIIARECGFKLAHLLMQKDREATAERSNRDTFMTGHSKSKKDIIERTQRCIRHLQQAGFKVWRYKIEDTLIDSRNADEFNLLDVGNPLERSHDDHRDYGGV
jgi:hypothetical protein